MNKTILLLLAIVLPRLPLLWNPLLHVDEATFAVGTQVWLSGGVPYIDFVETKALGVYLFYALGTLLGGSSPHVNMLVVHALTIVWAWGIALVVQRIGTRLASARVGWMAAFFFAVASTIFISEFVCPHIELILLLPWTLAVALLVRPIETVTSQHTFWAGMFTAAAILCKYQSGVLLPVVLCYCVAARWAPGLAWARLVRLMGWYGLGLLPLPAMLWMYLHHHHAWEAFWLWNFQGSAHYIAGGNALIHLSDKLEVIFRYLLITAILWYLVGIRALQWWRLMRTRHEQVAERLLWLWLIGALVAVAVGKRFFDHYFLLLTPPLALLAALAAAQWLQPHHPFRRRVLVTCLGMSLIVFAAARFVVHPLCAILRIEDMAIYEPYGHFLRDRTTAHDRVLVWGYAPAIYWYANRLPATRFLWSVFLVGDVPGATKNAEAIRRASEFIHPHAWDLFMQDLATHPPAYIIDMAPTGLHHYEQFPMTNYPRLMEFVRAHYEVMPDFQRASVWQHVSDRPHTM